MLRPIVFFVGLVAAVTLAGAAPRPLPDDSRCTADDRHYMARAYELARAAIQDHSGRPFGALLVLDGKIVAEFHNCEVATRDPTKHAETGLISTFAPKLGRAVLARATLYTSSEPCTMCCGAIRFAGIKKVVYGTTESQFVQIIGEPADPRALDSREIFARTAPDTIVFGPLMEAEGLAIHEGYWPTVHFGP